MKPTKRQRVLDFLIANEGATIPEICKAVSLTEPGARQMITYLRRDGHEIKTFRHGNTKASYHVTKVAEVKRTPSLMADLRVVLATGDEWTCNELAEMLKTDTKRISNAIGFIRRNEQKNIVTRQIGWHEFSYQQL